MLSLFRKHSKSWLIKAALFLIAVVFIFWGGDYYASRDATRLARVNDHHITIREHEKAYTQLLDMYRRQLGGAFSEDLVRQFNLRQQSLNMLIDNLVLRDSARRLRLTATPEEVQRNILQLPYFQTEGRFDRDLYLRVLQQSRITAEEFEQQMVEELTRQKVEAFIKRQAIVTDEEILSDFRFNHNLVQLAYVQFDPEAYRDKVVVEEDLLTSYYGENQQLYMDPEKRKVSMVIFKPESYMEEAGVTEEEIRAYYEDRPEEYQQEQQVRARHILFRVPEGASEEEVAKVKAEAEKVLEAARKEGADFGELATKHSQDPAGASNGGDLGYFARDRMVPEFSEAAFALKPGETSDLVRTSFGFHIIRVEDVRPEKTVALEEVQDEIRRTLREEKARDVAYRKARSFSDLAYAQKNVQKTAEAQNLQLTAPDQWLAQRDPLPGLQNAEHIMNTIFSLAEKETSDVLETLEAFVVAQVDAVQPPQVLPFEEVKDRVEQDFRADRARKTAQESASELIKSAGEANSLEDAAKQKGLEVKNSEWFSRRKPDKNLRLTADVQSQVFQLEESRPIPEAPLEIGGLYFVVQLTGKQSAAEETLEQERPAILKRLQQQKESQLWQSWIEEQRRRARIEVFQEV